MKLKASGKRYVEWDQADDLCFIKIESRQVFYEATIFGHKTERTGIWQKVGSDGLRNPRLTQGIVIATEMDSTIASHFARPNLSGQECINP